MWLFTKKKMNTIIALSFDRCSLPSKIMRTYPWEGVIENYLAGVLWADVEAGVISTSTGVAAIGVSSGLDWISGSLN